MALPTTRTEFKEYCLRKLGKPVIEINVDDTQVEDRIDEALQYYFDYHMDGSSKVFYKHQVTDTDKQNGYITLPNNFLAVIRVLDVSDLWYGYGDSAMFSPDYQYALNSFSILSTESLIPYYMDMERAALFDFLLASANPLRFNRHENRLYIDTDWDKFPTNDYIVIEGYAELDTTNADIWKDKWLIEYTSALIKMQWGQNLIKYEGMQLPGGVQLNGRQIYDDAKEEIEKLKQELQDNYQLPPEDFIG